MKGKIHMRKLLLVGLLILSLIPFGSASAQEGECEAIAFAHGWAQPALQVTGTGTVYGIIANLGTEDDALLSVSTDAAESVEFHVSNMEGEMEALHPVVGIALPAGSAVEFWPEGLHMMLVNLAQDLVDGEMVELTLSFEKAGELTVPVMIHEDTAMGMGGMEATMEAMDSMNATEEAGHMHGGDDMHMDMGIKTYPFTLLGECEGVKVVSVWGRPSVTTTGAAYGYVFNLTEEDDILLGGSTAAAEVVEIHNMVMENDVMVMSPLADGLTIPAGSMAQLKPGGLHIMMINLTQTLEVGNTIEVTLNFEKAGEITLTVPIQEPPAAMNMSH